MKHNIIKNIVRQELKKINEASYSDDSSTTDLDKAADAIDEINKLISDFKPKFDKAINDLEKYLPLALEDILTSSNGLLSEGDFWDALTADIDAIAIEVEDLMAKEEDEGPPPKTAKEIIDLIKQKDLVDEYLSNQGIREIDEFYTIDLKFKNIPSPEVDEEVYKTLYKERQKRGLFV